MDCNCSHNNKEISQCRVRHVYGNVLKIGVPLMLRTVTVEDGEIVTTDTEFIPSTNYPVSIELDNGRERPKFVATMEGNVARFEDAGTIPVGIYSLSVICKDDNGNPYRFKQRYVLQVVDTMQEAGIEEEIEFETQEWTLDGAIFLLMKGDKGDPGADGVGIEDIQTVENPNHGEYNTVTMYLTDGTSKSFKVRNGWGGISGIVVNNTLYTQNANGVIDLGMIIRQHQSLANYVSESEYNTRMLNYYRKNEIDTMFVEKDIENLDKFAHDTGSTTKEFNAPSFCINYEDHVSIIMDGTVDHGPESVKLRFYDDYNGMDGGLGHGSSLIYEFFPADDTVYHIATEEYVNEHGGGKPEYDGENELIDFD